MAVCGRVALAAIVLPSVTALTTAQAPDTDGDGVPNARDKCPNTPRGQLRNRVDSVGTRRVDCSVHCAHGAAVDRATDGAAVSGCRREDYDADGDGVCDREPQGTIQQKNAWCGAPSLTSPRRYSDNCPHVKNPMQEDSSPATPLGDACDKGAWIIVAVSVAPHLGVVGVTRAARRVR